MNTVHTVHYELEALDDEFGTLCSCEAGRSHVGSDLAFPVITIGDHLAFEADMSMRRAA